MLSSKAYISDGMRVHFACGSGKHVIAERYIQILEQKGRPYIFSSRRVCVLNCPACKEDPGLLIDSESTSLKMEQHSSPKFYCHQILNNFISHCNYFIGFLSFVGMKYGFVIFPDHCILLLFTFYSMSKLFWKIGVLKVLKREKKKRKR